MPRAHEPRNSLVIRRRISRKEGGRQGQMLPLFFLFFQSSGGNLSSIEIFARICKGRSKPSMPSFGTTGGTVFLMPHFLTHKPSHISSLNFPTDPFRSHHRGKSRSMRHTSKAHPHHVHTLITTPSPCPSSCLVSRHRQPGRRGFVRRERAHRVRQHVELPTYRYLRGALAQDPRPSFPDSLNARF